MAFRYCDGRPGRGGACASMSKRKKDEDNGDHKPPVAVHKFKKSKENQGMHDYEALGEHAMESAAIGTMPGVPAGIPDYGVGPQYPVRVPEFPGWEVPDWLPPVPPLPGPRAPRLPVPYGRLGGGLFNPRIPAFATGYLAGIRPYSRRKREKPRRVGAHLGAASRGQPYGSTIGRPL